MSRTHLGPRVRLWAEEAYRAVGGLKALREGHGALHRVVDARDGRRAVKRLRVLQEAHHARARIDLRKYVARIHHPAAPPPRARLRPAGICVWRPG